jgi:hypothetical protein
MPHNLFLQISCRRISSPFFCSYNFCTTYTVVITHQVLWVQGYIIQSDKVLSRQISKKEKVLSRQGGGGGALPDG